MLLLHLDCLVWQPADFTDVLAVEQMFHPLKILLVCIEKMLLELLAGIEFLIASVAGPVFVARVLATLPELDLDEVAELGHIGCCLH